MRKKTSFSERPGPFRITIKVHISNIRMLRWSILLGGNKGTIKVYASVTFLEHSDPNLPIVVSVLFVSNWRLALSKRMRDDYAGFLKANLWYYDRFDFEDLLFCLGSKIASLESMEELDGAMFLHNSLVSPKFVFKLHNARVICIYSLF